MCQRAGLVLLARQYACISMQQDSAMILRLYWWHSCRTTSSLGGSPESATISESSKRTCSFVHVVSSPPHLNTIDRTTVSHQHVYPRPGSLWLLGTWINCGVCLPSKFKQLKGAEHSWACSWRFRDSGGFHRGSPSFNPLRKESTRLEDALNT
jgi:hypothetical protein